MALIIDKMPSFVGVVAGSTAICNLPLGMAYHELMLRYTFDDVGTPTDATDAVFANDFAEVRLIVNGETKVQVTGAVLAALRDYYGQTAVAGTLPLYLARPWQRTIAGEDELAYGTADLQTMSLEIDLASDAAPVSLSLYARRGANEPLGKHIEIKKFSDVAAAAGTLEYPDIPPRGKYGLIAMHWATGLVTAARVEANGKIIMEGDAALLKRAYSKRRVWQSGYFHLDFGASDRLGDALPLTLNDFRTKPTFSGAGAFSVFVERVAGI